MSTVPQGTELLPYTLATWVYMLHVEGVPPADDATRQACEEIRAATDATAGNAASERLVARLRELTGGGAEGPHQNQRDVLEPDAVLAAARQLYGDRVRTDLGAGDRAERTAAIRKYQFASQRPWLARIWERSDGTVRPSWILVERVTDEVTAADPNPWNDIDETRHIPVGDFLVLWELDGCTSVCVG